ncbi:MAG: MBL fold metallo-hydrolase [Alphaproteobacteria bacterium]|nr:MBL fold metallo-hydrolase [Alphaproteobacteria bacterium]
MPLEVTVLGCGTSSGVPVPGVIGWGKCDPTNPKNRRMRVSIKVTDGDTCIWVDAGPDLREQLLLSNTNHIDGLIITHAHADHIHGIDDLRWINNSMRSDIPCYSDANTLQQLHQRFNYAMTPVEVSDKPFNKPVLTPHTIEFGKPFYINETKILPIEQNHGFSTSMGLRIGDFAYCTDVLDFSEQSWAMLQGVRYWIIDCLGYNPHPTHAHLDRVLEWVEILKPEQTYFTHMNGSLDYDTLCQKLPAHIRPAYDGLCFTVG